MAVGDDQLLEALELSPFVDPTEPGRLASLKLPGVEVNRNDHAAGASRLLGRATDLSHPYANLIGAALLEEASAPDVITAVRAAFAARGHAFGWMVGPRSAPPVLGDQLLAAGFTVADELAGLVLTDLRSPLAGNPAIAIREATLDDVPAANRVMARANALPEAVADHFNRRLFRARGPERTRAYLAYAEGDEEPAGFASWTPIPGMPVVALDGAATVVEHQRKGVYTSLVARRIDDAHAAGAEAAVIQAVRSTSAPICTRLGFAELGSFVFFEWRARELR